ncbi:hypothetical protein [Streptomyces noboritoensis]|uniref:hypothetical protein n=1 Tax=Streptomyces noboritoensis TaxID=67337 RepID=UPI00373FD588
MDRQAWSRRTVLRTAGGVALAAGVTGIGTPAVAAASQGRPPTAALSRSYRVGSSFVVAVGLNGGLFMNYSFDSPSPDGVGAYAPAVPIGDPGVAPAVAGVAGATQSERQADAFVVDNEGVLWVTWWPFSTPGARQRAALTPKGFAPAGAALTTGAQANDQRDVFVVGNDGVLYVLWEANNSAWSQPIPLTPPRFAPPGAALATGRQANDQLDVFVVGNDGALYVLWEANNGPWSQPIALTPPRFAPPGATLATGRQANDQLDVFVVGDDGVLYVLWEANNSAWSHPIALTSSRFAPPGAGVASVTQSDEGDFHQLDAFVVGNDGALYVTWEQNNSSWATPVRISGAGFAAPGAPVSAVKYDNGFASVIVPRTDKSLCEFRMLEQFGRWTGPKVLSAPGTVDPMARSTVIHHSTEVNESKMAEGFQALVSMAGMFFSLLDNRDVGAQLAVDAVQALRPLTADYPSYRRQLAEWEVAPATAFLTAVGRWDEAVTLGEESVSLYRKLAAENPNDDELAYRVSWASIEVAGKWWGKPELQAKATDLAVKGTDNLRALAARNPSYRRQLAHWATSPTAAFLAMVGRWDEAVAVGEEAVSLYRKLAAENPNDDELAYRVSWASIEVAGKWWGKPELQAKATDLAVKGTDNLRALATRTPSYRRDLAQWETSPTTAFLAAVGRWDEAVAVGEESVSLYRKLAAENPNDDDLAYRVSWASVEVAGKWWGKPELQVKAADLAAKGMDTLRALAARNPSYRRQLAHWTAAPTATLLAMVGRWDEAVAMGDESVDLYRKLVKEAPKDDELASQFSSGAMEVAGHLWPKPELRTKSTDFAVQAIDNLRILAARTPSYRPQLADWLMSPTSDFLVGTGQKQRAIALLQEAVDLYTQLNAADPSTYGPKLAAAKKKLADLQT